MGSLSKIIPELRSAVSHYPKMSRMVAALECLVFDLQNAEGQVVRSLGGVAHQSDVTTQIEAVNFTDLADVTVTNPTNGQVPTWQGGILVNQTPATSSGTATPDPGKFFARASLSSSLPFSTSAISAGKCYLHPFRGNRASTWNGSAWVENSLTSILSASVPAITGNCFDLTLHKSGSSLVLSTTNWTNSTTRATPVKLQNGVNILSGTTKRLVASGYVSASGRCVMNETKLNFVNIYNRMPWKLKLTDAANSWSTTSTSLVPWHSGTVGPAFVVAPLGGEYAVDVEYYQTVDDDVSTPQVGIGVDSTSVDSSDVRFGGGTTEPKRGLVAKVFAYLSAGRRFIWPLHQGSGLGITFYGDDSGSMQSGMTVVADS